MTLGYDLFFGNCSFEIGSEVFFLQSSVHSYSISKRNKISRMKGMTHHTGATAITYKSTSFPSTNVSENEEKEQQCKVNCGRLVMQ